MVRKRSGRREPFDRQKVVAGVLAAGKNRPISADDAEELAAAVESALVVRGPEVSSAAVGREVLLRLRSLDEVAYLRFASVYKGFAGPGDFAAELGLLGDPRPPSR
jgi:transcriptional repressor NrdR